MTNPPTALDRLRHHVVVAYTHHTVTRDGAVERKTPQQHEMDSAVAQAVVAFAVEFHTVDGYDSPNNLWLELMEQAIADGELIRPAGEPLQHHLDYQLAPAAVGA